MVSVHVCLPSCRCAVLGVLSIVGGLAPFDRFAVGIDRCFPHRCDRFDQPRSACPTAKCGGQAVRVLDPYRVEPVGLGDCRERCWREVVGLPSTVKGNSPVPADPSI